MKPNVFNSLVSSITATAFLLGMASSQAQTVYAEYRLGEAGSLGVNKLPQDSSGNARHFPAEIGGSTALVQTSGVSATGSTAYLDTSMSGNQGFFFNNNSLFTGLGTNNFAFGVYARGPSTAAAGAGDVFQLGANVTNTYKLSLESTGWRASSANTGYIGSTAAFTSNTWVHLALIRNNGQTGFFVNGVQQGGNFANAPTIGAPYLSQAPGNGVNANFDGHIDEARIVTFAAGETTANILAALTTVYVPPVQAPATGTWTSTVDGNWSVSSNWQDSIIASGSDNTATFSAGSGPIAVTLDSSRSIGNLAFSNADYTIGGTSLLTLDSTGTPGISVASDRTATLATTITGTLGLEKTGLGTLVLSGPTTYSGTTTISVGTLQVGAGSTTGGLGSGNVSIAGNLTFHRSNAYGTGTGQVFSGAGSITKNGAGDLVFNGGTDHTNVQGISNVVVNNGLIRTDSWGKWNNNLNLSVNGSGKFEMWNTSTSIANLSGNGIIRNTVFYGRANILTVAAGSFSGTITDSGITSGGAGTGDTRINLVKSSAGTLALSGVTSYTGSTTVAEGTLSLGNGATHTNLSDNATVSIALGTTVDLNFTGSDVVGKLIIDGTALPAGVYDGSVATPVEYRSYFTGTGSLTVLNQSGTWISTVDGNWSASSNWQSGIIATGSDKTATFSAGSGPVAVTLDTNRILGNMVFTNADYTIGGANVLTLDATGAPSVSVDTGLTATLATNVSGTLGFTKTGSGTLILSAANNSYSGTTTITEGTVQIGGAGRLGSGTYANTISIASGATLQYSSSAGQTLSGAITGQGGITKDTGNNDLILSNAGNNYSGTTTVSAGRINVSAPGQLSNGATSIVQSGTGQIYCSGTGQTIANNFNISTAGFSEPGDVSSVPGAIRSDGNNNFSGTTTLSGNSRIGAFGATRTNTISGQITGSGAMSFYGISNVNGQAQAFVLSNTTNNYTGDTQIDAKDYAGTYSGNSTTLRLGASNVIPNGATAGNVVFNGADANSLTILDLNQFSETINGLSAVAAAGATITNNATGASVLTIGANDTTSSFSGKITDAGAGKTLAIIKTGSGTLTLSGVNNYIGATSVSQGTLALVGGTQASPITMESGASLDFTLASPVSSSSTLDLTNGTVKITGTPSDASYLLMTASGGITGTPTLFAAIPGYDLVKANGDTELRLEQVAGYSAWQTANGTDQTMDLDHDNDGVPNGVEFFLGGTVDTTGFTTPLPGVDKALDGTLSVTWTKAATYPETAAYGTDYAVETSETLTGAWTPETVGGNVTESGSEVKYTFPSPLGTRKFARLKVTGP